MTYRGPVRHRHTLLRLTASLLGGLALWLSFPGAGLWWLAPGGVAPLAASWLTTTAPRAFAWGLVGGLAFFVPTLSWSGIYVGRVPWFALAGLVALYVAAQAAATSLVGRRLLRRARGVWGAALALLTVPLGWVVQELARGTTPFGGFPWAKLAFSQADSPLARLAAIGGAPLVTFAVALCGAALLAAAAYGYAARARPAWLRGSPPGRGVTVGVVMAGLVAPVLLALVVPVPTDGRRVTIGMVQGNVPQAGLDFNAQRRAVLDNHVRGTEQLAALDTPGLSLVIWPENASDIDPLRNADAAAQVQRAVDTVDVPLLLGAVLAEPEGHATNASLLYRPGGGAPERYTKIHVVPFAEYIPYRSFFRIFTPAADLAGNFVAGDRLVSFRVEDRAGGAAWTAIPTICFEVAYDGLMRDAVLAAPGESLLVVQTNNATFGYSAESEQQLAISRIRAIEHGRAVAHVSTVGVSALVHPDGSVEQQTRLFTPAQIVGRPMVRAGTTVADRLGHAPDIVAVAALLVLFGLGFRGERGASRTRGDGPADEPRPTAQGGRPDPDLQRA